MEKVFTYKSYKNYLQDHINTQSQGVKKAISAAMSISPSLLSQVLSGDRDLSPEQAYRFATHMGFNTSEKAYWLLLLDYERATSRELKKFIEDRLDLAAEEFETNTRMRQGHHKTTWTQEFIAVFYSSWHFGAIYCVMATTEKWTAHTLAERLLLPVKRVQGILDFLLENKVVEKVENAHYRLNATNFVHIAGADTLTHKAASLHNAKNLRRKAMDVYEEAQFDKDKESYSPTLMALLSEKDYRSFKKELQKVVDLFHKKVAVGNFEEVVCLNIDYFKI